MADGDYIKLSRSILTWEWYSDIPVRLLFFHLLLSCRYAPGRWQGIDLAPGQIPTSLPSLATGTGLSMQQIRTALKKLESTGEITDEATRQYRLITVRNWAKWQAGKTVAPTDEQQTSNRRATDKKQTSNSTIRREEGKKGRREEVATEVATAFAGTELPLGLEPIQNPPPSSAEPPSKANPDVSFVVEHLTGRLQERGLARALDPSEQSNRRYAYLLIQRLAKDYPSVAPREVAERLIDFATGHPVHGGRCTHVKYLFYNIGTLTNDARKSRSGGSDDYARRAAEAAARRFAEGAEHAGTTPAGDAVPVGE